MSTDIYPRESPRRTRQNIRMGDFSELLRVIDDRLAELNGLSERKACLNAGLKVDAIRTIRRGNAPKPDTLVKLANALRLDKAILFAAAAAGEAPDAGTERRAMATVSELGLDAAAGPGVLVDSDHTPVVAEWQLPADFLRSQVLAHADSIKIIHIVGDSMEPEIPSGSKVMVNIADRRPTPPGIFVIWDGMGLVVKRVEFIPHSDPPRVRIKSANPEYSPYERLVDEAHIQGRVVGRWKWT